VTALTIEEIFSRGDFKVIEEEGADKNKPRENEEMYLSDTEDTKMKMKDILKQRMNDLAEERELKKRLLERRRQEIAGFKEYFE
jgi:hypothetical protein